MTSSDFDKQWSGVARFLGGSVLGSFLILLPLLYSDIDSLGQLTGLQAVLGMLMVICCGSLAAKWGTPFIDAVMRGLDNAGF